MTNELYCVHNQHTSTKMYIQINYSCHVCNNNRNILLTFNVSGSKVNPQPNKHYVHKKTWQIQYYDRGIDSYEPSPIDPFQINKVFKTLWFVFFIVIKQLSPVDSMDGPLSDILWWASLWCHFLLRAYCCLIPAAVHERNDSSFHQSGREIFCREPAWRPKTAPGEWRTSHIWWRMYPCLFPVHCCWCLQE